MPKLTILVGLPASGKSTWAREEIAKTKNTIIISKDDLRSSFYKRNKNTKGRWTHERHIVAMRNKTIDYYLGQGIDVISDDCNLNPVHIETFKKIAEQRKAEIELKRFDIPVSEAEERDARRENGVGPKIIRRMWRDYVCVKEYQGDTSLPKAITVDLDGTLAHMNGRGPFDEDLVETDDYDTNVAVIVQAAAAVHKAKIIISSGRHNTCREATERWLQRNKFHYDDIIMRDADDNRPDYETKSDMFDILMEKYYIIDAFDDRIGVVDMLRSRKGIKVFGCADGVF